MIKAVIFDIDGVLLNSFDANLKFYQDLFTFVKHKPPTREDFQTLFHLSMIDVIKTITKLKSEEEIKKIWEIGKSEKVKYRLDMLTMPKDADKTIETLSKSYPLGIVTSRIRESVYEVPNLAKLQKYFKVAVAYQDTVNHKPHPEPLLLAAKKLKVKPEECVYIGDVENDIKAGKAAGMKVIIYSKKLFKNADCCTQVFGNLPKLIGNL